ncbi:MAG: cytochrome b [Burkholderiaceae bacterium]|nr:cytochrome b [Burkholderiaceae bacterium]
MNRRNTTDRYGSLSIALHWVMVLLLIAVYACIELREFFPKDSDPRNALKTWHFMLGLSVLALVVVRMLVNLTSPTPRIVPNPPQWQNLSAKAMHIALYALMVGLPLAGWLMLSASGKPIPFFGLQLPALIGQNKELAGTIKELHEAGGTIGYFLIGLHALAGLYHHYFVRDNTLVRMLPGRD